MPIPQKVANLLALPCLAFSTTRNASLTPVIHFTWGVRTAADGAHVEVLVPTPFAGPLHTNIDDNQRFALTIVDARTNEAYQLKGRCVELRDSTGDERAFQQRWAETNLEYLAAGMPAHHIATLGKVASAPSTYVRFHVDEVYLQTPGPTAGQPLPLDG